MKKNKGKFKSDFLELEQKNFNLMKEVKNSLNLFKVFYF